MAGFVRRQQREFTVRTPSARQAPDWRRYERLIARLIADHVSTDLCVTPNASIRGRITKVLRQVDVLIEARHDTDNTRRIVVDAKRHRRRVDVKDVEAFRGFMEDVNATHGYLICPVGFTKAAKRRAQQKVSIRLLPLDQVEGFDPTTWPECQSANCISGRIFWDGYPGMYVRERSAIAMESDDRVLHFGHYVGKCDRCHRFHVKCLTCGTTLLAPEDDDDDCGQQCICRPPWFWIASIEQDARKRESAELHVAFLNGDVQTVDRRSL